MTMGSKIINMEKILKYLLDDKLNHEYFNDAFIDLSFSEWKKKKYKEIFKLV